VKPERLVNDDGGDADAEDVQFQVTVSFVDESGKTTLTMRLLFESVEECEKARAFGAIRREPDAGSPRHTSGRDGLGFAHIRTGAGNPDSRVALLYQRPSMRGRRTT
jgi:hypothetical protein